MASFIGYFSGYSILFILFLNKPLLFAHSVSFQVNDSLFVVSSPEVHSIIPEAKLGNHVYTTLNPNDGNLYIQNDSLIYCFNTQTYTWSLAGALEFYYTTRRSPVKSYTFRSAFMHDGETMRFWSWGLGEVYDFNLKTGAFKRLDKSFNQLNQLGHSWHFNPKTGLIYAFGGYGLFSGKNLFTYYDTKLDEWELFRTKSQQLPPFSEWGSMIYDSVSSQFMIHINKYRTKQTDMELDNSIIETNQLWTYSPETLEWKNYGAWNHQFINEQDKIAGMPAIMMAQTFDLSSRLWFGLHQADLSYNPKLTHHLIVIDVDTYEQYVFPTDLLPKSILHMVISLLYDAKTRRLYAISISEGTNSLPIDITYLTIPETSVLKAVIEKTQVNPKIADVNSASFISVLHFNNLKLFGYLSLFLVGLGSGFFVFTLKAKKKRNTNLDLIKEEQTIPLSTKSNENTNINEIEIESIFETNTINEWILDFSLDSSNPTIKTSDNKIVLDYSVNIDEKWLLIFIILFEEKFKSGLDSHYYSIIFSKNRESSDSLRKTRQAKIEQINSFLADALNIELGIQSMKSPYDGRRVLFKLDESLCLPYEILGDLEKIISNSPSYYRKFIKNLLSGEFNIHSM